MVMNFLIDLVPWVLFLFYSRLFVLDGSMYQSIYGDEFSGGKKNLEQAESTKSAILVAFGFTHSLSIN